MKIAILTEILSTHSGSRAPIELAKSLSLDNKVTLMAFAYKSEKGVKEELEKQGIKVILAAIPPLPLGKWLAAFTFLPHLKDKDIISFHGTLPTFLVARLSGIPLVTTYYGTQLNAYLERLLPTQKPNLKDKILNWLVNQAILITQKVYFCLSNQSVAISKYTSCEAKKLFGQDIPYIHLGVTQLVNPSRQLVTRSPRAKPKGNSLAPSEAEGQQINILTVSRITPYKGFHLLIDAVKKSQRDLNLIIVGSSPQPKYLEYLKKIKTSKTRILIDVSDNQLAKLYQECDIYASCDRFLFFGLPPLEAALFGKPSVLFDYCAAPEVVQHHKTGFVAKNMPDFVKYLQILTDNHKMRTQMGRRAKKWAENNFSWEKTDRLYREMFKKWKN